MRAVRILSNDGSRRNLQLKEEADVAVKIIKKSRLSSDAIFCSNFIKEIKAHWRLLDCDGVVELLDIFEDEELVYLVLEY
jgi:hypothetical protein